MRGSRATARHWQPDYVSSGFKAWIDMQDTGAYSTSSGKVSEVVNKVSSVAWTEATDRPAFSATALNGRPCMAGDGDTSSARILTTETAVINALGAVSGTGSRTLAFVAQFNSLSANRLPWGYGQEADSNFSGGFFNDSATLEWGLNRVFMASSLYESSGDIADTSPHVFYTTFDGTNEHCYIDGGSDVMSLISGLSGKSVAGLTRFGLLCLPRATITGFFDGQLGEVLLWDRVLDSTEEGLVTGYLKRHWGLT